MVIVKCGRNITLNISQVSPGNGESWIVGDPVINWGDGTESISVSGATASHAYQDIGMYTITLDGENACGNICSHTEVVVMIENPTNLTTSNITTNRAKVGWNSVLGAVEYYWELWRGTTYVNGNTTPHNYINFSGLIPNTEYNAYISVYLDGELSEDYCGENCIVFTTLHDVCEPPVCDFTVHDQT